jgi:hypothetical protein
MHAKTCLKRGRGKINAEKEEKSLKEKKEIEYPKKKKIIL